jgi:hypothetical protein
MAVRTQFQLFTSLSALLLTCAVGCSSDDSGSDDGDGDGTEMDAGTDDGTADGNESTGDEADGTDEEPKPELTANTAGKACDGESACGEGTCASALTGGSIGALLGISLETEGGYCTAPCEVDATCGEGGECFGALVIPPPFDALLEGVLPLLGIESTDGECRQACTPGASSGCRTGYECAELNEAALDQAPEDLRQFIDLPPTCQPAPVTDQLTDTVGDACQTDATCGDGFCIPATIDTGDAGIGSFDNALFPGGYCSGVCVDDADCGTDGACVRGAYGSAGTCYESCTVDSDCAREGEGYTCQEQGGKNVCAGDTQEPEPTEDSGVPAPEGDAGV